MISAAWASQATRLVARWSPVAVCCVLAIASGRAQDQQPFWVAPTGSDATGNGSSTAPWATVSNAVAKMPEAGGTIIVRDGTYDRLSISRKFKAPLVIRAEHPYRAVLRANNTVVLSIVDAANVVVTGFDIAKTAYPNSPLGAQIARSESIALIDNIIHDSMNNDVLKVNEGSRRILILGNLLYNPQGTAGQLIDLNGTVDVTIRENIFLNAPNPSGPDLLSTHGFIVVKNSDQLPEGRRNWIKDNVFLNFYGSTGSNFILFGEDGQSMHETQDAVVENNLLIGNSGVRMRSPFGVKGCRDILFRNNTVTGDLPSSAFGTRLNREGNNQKNRNIAFYNNIWSDPAGTMTNFSDGPPQDTTGSVLERNLYWNAGQALPGGENLTPARDPEAVTRNPYLRPPDSIAIPNWTGAAFATGSSTIRQEFERIVRLYGTPAVPRRQAGRVSAIAETPTTGGASVAHAPAADILGRPRGVNPDFGAVQDDALDQSYRIILLREELAGGAVTTINQVVLRNPAGPGGVTIKLTSSDPAIVRVPASVRIDAGAAAAPFTVETGIVEQPVRVMLSAYGPDGESGTALTVTPAGVHSVNLGADPITASNGIAANRVLYDGVAGPEGVTIELKSSRPELVQVPEIVKIQPGNSYSDLFAISTRFTAEPVTVTITASAGSSSASSELTLTPPVFELYIPDQISGEALIHKNRLTLDRPAPPGGAQVQLSNPRPDLMELPATVVVPEGQITAAFDLRTKIIDADTYLKVTATWVGRSVDASFRLGPLKPYSLTIPASVGGGSRMNCSLLMASAAENPVSVQLSANDGAPVTVPESVVVPPDNYSAPFTVQTQPVAARTPVRITATYRGHSVSADTVLLPAQLSSIAASTGTVTSGNKVTFTVTAGAIAPEGGVAVALSSSGSALMPPPSVMIPAGSSTASFTVTAGEVFQATPVRISATLDGLTRTVDVTVVPIEVMKLLIPVTASGGSNEAKTSRVVLTAPAFAGTRIRLSSSNPLVASVPAEVIATAGETNVYFAITTVGVREPVSVRITGIVNTVEVSATMTVIPPGVASVVLTPAEIRGGLGSSVNTAYFSAPALDDGIRVTFVSSNPDVVPHPAEVTAAGRSLAARFTYTTRPVTTETLVTITATGGGRSASAILKVKP